MAQSGWRLPEDLLRRVRVRCAEEGVRQNAWVERALERALGAEDRVPERAVPAPSRASAKKTEIALEVRDAVQKRNRSKPVNIPGVQTAASLMAERQARLNKAKGS